MHHSTRAPQRHGLGFSEGSACVGSVGAGQIPSPDSPRRATWAPVLPRSRLVKREDRQPAAISYDDPMADDGRVGPCDRVSQAVFSQSLEALPGCPPHHHRAVLLEHQEIVSPYNQRNVLPGPSFSSPEHLSTIGIHSEELAPAEV